jgi:hypothetical protein
MRLCADGEAAQLSNLIPLPAQPVASTPLWRYTQLWKLLDMLQRKVLRLTPLETLRVKSDPYESSVPVSQKGKDQQMMLMTAAQHAEQNAQLAAHGGGAGVINYGTYFDEWVPKVRKGLLRSAHASCWRYGEESEAMWKLYCGSIDGVTLRTTFGKLEGYVNQHSDTCLSRVSYRDYLRENFERYEQEYDPALHKRIAFRHEQEVRVLHCRREEFIKATGDPGFYSVPVELPNWVLETIIDGIIVNPFCSTSYLGVVQAAVRHVSPGLADKVKASEHRIDPVW